MRAYQVFKHPDKGYKAVKIGFSWPGFVLGAIWPLTMQMWLSGIVLLVIAIAITISGRTIFHENPPFYYFLWMVYRLTIGFKGNLWRSASLGHRGYLAIGQIVARNRSDAIAKVANAGGIVPPEFKTGYYSISAFPVPRAAQRVFAIVSLTWKAAFRYKFFWVITALLLAAVVGLPMLVKDDGTAAGFAQILLTYTLTSVTGLLGLCTLWLSCGTLARDVEDCQIQMVAVKPIARWQIWLGKWLGIVLLNAALLALAGMSIYGVLEYRARRLPPAELTKLKDEVLVARGSAREENLDGFIQKETDKRIQNLVAQNKTGGLDMSKVQKQVADQVRAELQVIPPNAGRVWRIPLGKSAVDELKDRPLFLRIKFACADPSKNNATFVGDWFAGEPKKTRIWHEVDESLAADTFHEFKIATPHVIDDKGDLIVAFRNLNDTALLFPLDEGMEVLYQQGGFGVNFARGLVVILCWMALLAAIGLAAASFLSFPVAAFVSMALMTMVFSSGTLATVVSDGTIMGWNEETSTKGHSPLDNVAVPTFRMILDAIQLVQQFSPIDSLSTGRCITWLELARAVGQIVMLMGGAFALIGIFNFNRRELATAQGNH